ncbi:hypothetical protein LTR10_017026 [Elasticomyces elasticus]|uniref:Uncharacterized protein n=1 Tax=Exophiala sideris TaxID=1016849 RepID=A0ABR0IZM0_9EURO|nr:hypothetical protein LTR10_017026 [Elasticomyces elasticus]KAK5023035.1 hypothetical protein LTS07_009528 [Exophiala sideris]KAK5026760.1 hypothetical protein LTR13_009800 [Exophiala sideris]KAK5052413.1 hypothetical protein LTR69_009751 [Exophiala sideris]KAK5178198.1 hypothetical protein LTR44_009282 [Eurotiomycetes sp. CCFEE 6388]
MGPLGNPPATSSGLSTKSLPYRNDSRNTSPTLRMLYRNSAQDGKGQQDEQQSHKSISTVLPTSPQLPPTPPGASNEDRVSENDERASEAAVFRSSLVTPINQNSPPTPDNTPPRDRKIPFVRPFLGVQPSSYSTRAESFTTAREDMVSEDELDNGSPYQEGGLEDPRAAMDSSSQVTQRLRQSALPRSPLINMHDEQSPLGAPQEQFADEVVTATNHNADVASEVSGQDHRLHASPQPLSTSSTPERLIRQRQDNVPTIRVDEDDRSLSRPRTRPPQNQLKRDKSLRDRLLEAQTQDPSASTEKFANIIGWNNSVPLEDTPATTRDVVRDDTRRFSGISTTSTIEAYVFEQITPPKRKTTLRHVSKHESLRSVSSPLPASNRNSLQSTSDSPHRLVHKKARLNNHNRWSFGSEVSRSQSLASSALLPKTEVIRVAVIPERKSSLPSSSTSESKRQSLSTGSARSHAAKLSDNPPSSWQHKRTLSESTDRGRTIEQAPVIPPRRSSLSAPTSRSTSRANSVTSENVRVRRQQAEKDFRKTLIRMETEMLIQTPRVAVTEAEDQPLEQSVKLVYKFRPSVDAWEVQTPSTRGTFPARPLTEGEAAINAFGLVVPGTQEWAALRPASTLLETPFSQPSFRSASPEINEAKAINYFAHNNHSLQLIEPFPVQESKAVREVQRQQLPHIEMHSPLRNPRPPPDPPYFQVIPPTPGDELEQEPRYDASAVNARQGSVKRPGGSRRRSESFVSSISRNLSLKNARNKKADQELDGELHPFWRPRAFWDDIDSTRPDETQNRALDGGIVKNSLGLPQERTVITGPVSLVRRLSERRRQKRGIVKQSSHGSLARLRAGRQLYSTSGLGYHFHLLGFKDLHERIIHVKQKKEDERREKRRAQLRRSIGANVVMQGDSRFPASNTSLSRNI